ncbi:MAG: hypothetical protein Ct9H300mP1_02550 [Planctomycetaceae bacterium]|nr:MAG: hypothetical protein Ct9H300mP1_02550 [Planctomycetaceae bacterium]
MAVSAHRLNFPGPLFFSRWRRSVPSSASIFRPVSNNSRLRCRSWPGFSISVICGFFPERLYCIRGPKPPSQSITPFSAVRPVDPTPADSPPQPGTHRPCPRKPPLVLILASCWSTALPSAHSAKPRVSPPRGQGRLDRGFPQAEANDHRPGSERASDLPRLTGFVGWESVTRLRNGDLLCSFSAGYWHVSFPTPIDVKPPLLKQYIRGGFPAKSTHRPVAGDSGAARKTTAAPGLARSPCRFAGRRPTPGDRATRRRHPGLRLLCHRQLVRLRQTPSRGPGKRTAGGIDPIDRRRPQLVQAGLHALTVRLLRPHVRQARGFFPAGHCC